MTPDEARQLALALPKAVEQDHHGRPSFRVGGKIFATLWDERTMNVMLDEPGIHTAVETHPRWCAERWWGKRLAAIAVSLPDAPCERLAELLADAWECSDFDRFEALADSHLVGGPDTFGIEYC